MENKVLHVITDVISSIDVKERAMVLKFYQNTAYVCH